MPWMHPNINDVNLASSMNVARRPGKVDPVWARRDDVVQGTSVPIVDERRPRFCDTAMKTDRRAVDSNCVALLLYSRLYVFESAWTSNVWERINDVEGVTTR